jgi:hypothetical protein
MIKYLKMMLSRSAEDGTTVDYVENVFDSEDGLRAIDQNLFVGSYLFMLLVSTVYPLINTGPQIKDLCCRYGLKLCKTAYLHGIH